MRLMCAAFQAHPQPVGGILCHPARSTGVQRDDVEEVETEPGAERPEIADASAEEEVDSVEDAHQGSGSQASINSQRQYAASQDLRVEEEL